MVHLDIAKVDPSKKELIRSPLSNRIAAIDEIGGEVCV
jgi:hypothetical protein